MICPCRPQGLNRETRYLEGLICRDQLVRILPGPIEKVVISLKLQSAPRKGQLDLAAGTNKTGKATKMFGFF